MEKMRAEVQELSNLNEGWIDGENGSIISETALNRAHEVVQAVADAGLLVSSVFPTEEGGVKFFWSQSVNKLSFDVDRNGDLYAHCVDLKGNTFREETITINDNLAVHLKSWFEQHDDEEEGKFS